MRKGSLFGAGWIAAILLAAAALLRFAVVAHQTWVHRNPRLDLRAAIAHSHLLSLSHRTDAQLVLLPTLALVSLAVAPLLRVGIQRGALTWRGALAGSTVVAAGIIAVALYRYEHSSVTTYGKIDAARQARELARIATDLVLFTGVGIAAAQARRRLHRRAA